MNRSSAQKLELTGRPFFSDNTGLTGSTKAGINGWTVLQWEHWINGYTVLQCKHWKRLWQTAWPFFSNCWL